MTKLKRRARKMMGRVLREIVPRETILMGMLGKEIMTMGILGKEITTKGAIEDLAQQRPLIPQKKRFLPHVWLYPRLSPVDSKFLEAK